MSYIDKFDLLNRADSVYAFGFGEERARAWEREKERMHAAAVAFGEARGWKLSRRSFGIASLLRKGKDDPYLPCWWDHPYYYKVGRRPVAVVSHPYKCSVTFEDAAGWADAVGLVATEVPSWYRPPATVGILFEAAPRLTADDWLARFA